MSTKQAAIEMARRTGRSVILTEDGELAVAERRDGAMVGWRTDAGTLLPADHPRQLAAQPSGAVLHADGRLDRRQRTPHTSNPQLPAVPAVTDHRSESGSQLPAPAPRYSLRIGPARRRAFLRALAETGSFVAAARAASPHTKTGGAASFRQLMKRDPEFADQVQEAEDIATAKLEAIAMERAVIGVDRPVVSAGKIVTTERVVDNNLLRWLLQARNPEKYGDRSRLDINAKINSTHAAVFLTGQDLLALSDQERSIFSLLLEKIAAARGEVEIPYGEARPDDAHP